MNTRIELIVILVVHKFSFTSLFPLDQKNQRKKNPKPVFFFFSKSTFNHFNPLLSYPVQSSRLTSLTLLSLTPSKTSKQDLLTHDVHYGLLCLRMWPYPFRLYPLWRAPLLHYRHAHSKGQQVPSLLKHTRTTTKWSSFLFSCFETN